MKFEQLDEIEVAELRKRVHAHAHEMVVASFHLGTPRMRDKVAMNKAITAAALIYSDDFKNVWDKAIENPEVAMTALANEVRQDEEQRLRDEAEAKAKEIALIDASIERAKA